MIFLKFLPVGVLLGVLGFIVLGPGRDWFTKGKEVLSKKSQEIVIAQNQVLGQSSADDKTPPGTDKKSSNIVEEILSPINQTATTVRKTVESIRDLPQDKLEAIKEELCKPRR